MNKKLDRRAKYSQKVIKESFLSLLKEKSISKITVTEICSLADVNRATFYAYYTDSYDLMNKIEMEFIDEIKQQQDILSTTDEDEYYLALLQYIYDNAKMCRVLLEKNIEKNFERQVAALLEQRTVNLWTKNHKFSKEKASYVYAYHVYGTIAILRRWILEDPTKTPEEILQLTKDIMQAEKHLPG